MSGIARTLMILASVLGIADREAGAQAPVMLQGIADAEGWATDNNSNLLSRNSGKPAAAGRVMLWGAAEPASRLILYALVEAERRTNVEEEVNLQQLALRYALSRALVIDAGKINGVVGTFAARRFSTRNPLIMAPDAYPVQYPIGVQLSGVVRVFDYRAAVVSLAVVHEGYTPDPTPAPRPAIGAGITPFVGVRLGASYTQGPYLNDDLSASQLYQRSWDSYDQRVFAADLKLTYGYFELHGEAGHASFDVPGQSETVDGLAYYVEGKYTIGPRFFVATRLQRNDYPFIRPVTPTVWVARKTDFHDEELGVGFRVSASTLLKASYHQDKWRVNQANQAFIRPGGKAFALQLSQEFDVVDWMDRLRSH